MGSNVIHRGTTPNVICKAKGDLSKCKCFFSIGAKARHSWFTVEPDDISVSYERLKDVSTITFQLTQEQTLSCSAGKALAQFRAIEENGNAMVSNIDSVEIADIVKDGLIDYE